MATDKGEDTSVVAVDIETTGLDPWKEKITCIGFHTADREGVLRLEHMDSVQNIKDPVVGHRFKFDQKFLKVNNIEVFNWQHCTQLMAHICLDKVPRDYLEYYERLRQIENKKLPQGVTHRKAGGLSLKTLAPYFLGVDPFWEDPANHDNDEYVLKDCKYTYNLYQMFRRRLIGQGSWDFYRTQFNKVKMLFEMEMRGIELNFNALSEVEQEYMEKRTGLANQLKEMWKTPIDRYFSEQSQQLEIEYLHKCQAAIDRLKNKDKAEGTKARYRKLYHNALAKVEPFNMASSAQMAWLLRDQLGYNITCDETGDETTKKSVLNRLAKEGKEDVKTYLNWREAEKVLTMYLPTYRELQTDGVIHATFNPTGTRTGRLSSSGPNLQQVPSKLYKLFKPRDGYVFLQHDLAGIEAALIALYSGDKSLFKILQEGGSIHNYNAITFFNLDCRPEEVPEKFPKERRTAKTIGFALFYGAGFRRIKEAFLTNGYLITDAEAKEKLKAFRKFYSGATDFHKGITEIFEQGGVVNNLFGRPIRIQEWENPFMNGFNTLIQSSASDLNIRACEKATEQWREAGIDAHPLMLIHDCIVAEAPREQAEAADKILVECMTGFNLNAEHGPIKLEVDGGIYDEWTK